MSLLKSKQAIGILALSNGLSQSQYQPLCQLEQVLAKMGLSMIWPPSLFVKESVYHAKDEVRAEILMEFYKNPDIHAIFDVSGGDLANGVLPYLDYEWIKNHPKPFFGYSDLSVVLNALYAKTGHPTYLYQIRNLVGARSKDQQQWFYESLLSQEKSLFEFPFKWIQGEVMEGVVVGGNIRCFLKLAGTEYWPSVKGKLLLLEAYSGDVAKMATYLTQYKQLGVFNEIHGLILGHFTQMQKTEEVPDIVTLVQQIVGNPKLPIIKTDAIGHGADAKCVMIGGKYKFKNQEVALSHVDTSAKKPLWNVYPQC